MKFKVRPKPGEKLEEKPKVTKAIGAVVDDKIEMGVEDKGPDEDSLLHMILLSNSDMETPTADIPDTFTDFSFGQYDESTSNNLKLLGNPNMFDF